MSIFKKLLSLAKGTATDAGQAIVDANAGTIIAQEIRDAKVRLDQVRDQRAAMMGRANLANRRSAELQAEIERYEQALQAAHANGEAALVKDIAGRVAALLNEKAREDAKAKEFIKAADVCAQTIRKLEGDIETFEAQASMSAAVQAVVDARSTVAAKHAGANTALGDAMQSLERRKQRQAERLAHLDAAEQIEAEQGGGNLDARLAAAGLSPAGGATAESVLARLTAAPAAADDVAKAC